MIGVDYSPINRLVFVAALPELPLGRPLDMLALKLPLVQVEGCFFPWPAKRRLFPGNLSRKPGPVAQEQGRLPHPAMAH